MTKELMTPAELSERLGIPTGTLANWRYRGIGPTFIKMGRRVAYDAASVDAWLTAQTMQGTAEAHRVA